MIRILQVKQYHKEIAQKKLEKANQKISSMFYFMHLDNKGFPVAPRRNGWVVFDNTKAVWGGNINKALEKFCQ